MTKDEFMLQKSESERIIRRRVIPVGLIYSVRMASFLGLALCGVFLWKFYNPAFYTPILPAACVLILLFGISFPAARSSNRRFARFALKCPSCQRWLVFSGAAETVKTGCCYGCGNRIFDL
jgi:hypothetical protein